MVNDQMLAQVQEEMPDIPMLGRDTTATKFLHNDSSSDSDNDNDDNDTPQRYRSVLPDNRELEGNPFMEQQEIEEAGNDPIFPYEEEMETNPGVDPLNGHDPLELNLEHILANPVVWEEPFTDIISEDPLMPDLEEIVVEDDSGPRQLGSPELDYITRRRASTEPQPDPEPDNGMPLNPEHRRNDPS